MSTQLAAENRGDGNTRNLNTMGPADPQALNRYSYVLNNPLNYTDPTGHDRYPDSVSILIPRAKAKDFALAIFDKAAGARSTAATEVRAVTAGGALVAPVRTASQVVKIGVKAVAGLVGMKAAGSAGDRVYAAYTGFARAVFDGMEAGADYFSITTTPKDSGFRGDVTITLTAYRQITDTSGTVRYEIVGTPYHMEDPPTTGLMMPINLYKDIIDAARETGVAVCDARTRTDACGLPDRGSRGPN